jgi:hypothetical protein
MLRVNYVECSKQAYYAECVVMLNTAMLSVIMLNVIMLSIVMLNVVAPY